MSTQNETTRIALVGEEIVTNEAEALIAARNALAWHGNSENDRHPELVECYPEINEEGEETGRYEVRECWGDKASRDSDNLEVISTYDTEAEAEAHVSRHNNEAAQSLVNAAEWIELPVEPDFIWFPGCEQGKYPQSRQATISLRFGAAEVEATGYGDSRFIRDTFNHAAAAGALERVCDAVKAATKGYYAARNNEVLSRIDRSDVVALCRAVKVA